MSIKSLSKRINIVEENRRDLNEDKSMLLSYNGIIEYKDESYGEEEFFLKFPQYDEKDVLFINFVDMSSKCS